MDSTLNSNILGSSASKRTFSQLGQERVNFPSEEEKILQYWRDIDAFKTQLEKSKGNKPYTFYDGPPFATGTPHYGHLLAGTIKDVVCRYASQTGHYVERRFGWDTHGVPVEYEIEKDLEIHSREDVMKMGIAKYNTECRKIVMRCAAQWEKTVERMGRWIDFKNDYKTLDKTFMESVWWVFKEIHDKGLLYRGYKVMPYSTALNTPLSNFEAKSNYQKKQDPAIIVTFPLVNDENTYFLAWTTTPWTLPSNLALCVNKNLTYVKLQSSKDGKFYICGKDTLQTVKKDAKDHKLKEVQQIKGEELVGLKYVPLFPYFTQRKDNFRVICDDFVSATDGTAIVHQAPGFGEDDFRVCEEHKIYEKGEEVPCPVDHMGRFTAEVTDYVGEYVLDANKKIIKDLKVKGRLWSEATIEHEYPMCWRSETPLLYKAIPSWFIKVTQIKDQLLKNNEKTYWVPDNVKMGKFHNWLEQARDWAVSRNRYWGTPLPIWISENGDDWEVIGSIAELEERSGRKIDDLHREFVDDIVIKSKKTGKELRRVDEVFDCWFESGSMPYAQCHYPFAFKNREDFKKVFPGDFIAEGIDQTRGWFYTLLVISTAIFDEPAWKNLIVNGLVLAEDGRKMSKRLKNYPEPERIFENYGADALRVYLCNSPVVRAENIKFSESGVAAVIKDVLSPWWNAYKFFIENADRFERHEGVKFTYDENVHKKVTNVMDQWILSELQSLISFVRKEMEEYRLYTVVPELLRFIDKLCNWYVRTNRTRLRGQETQEDALLSLSTLYNVLLSLCQLMAPLTPFVVESMYLNLRNALGPHSEKSVHFLPIPTFNEAGIHKDIERRVHNLQTVIELGRNVRDNSGLKIKVPLTEAIVVSQDQQFLEDVKGLVEYAKSELNCKEVRFSNELTNYITLSATPIFAEIGPHFKKKAKQIEAALKTIKHEQVLELLTKGVTHLCDEEIKPNMVSIVWNFTGDEKKYGAANAKGTLVLLNKEVPRELELEGVVREVANRIQKLRKKGCVTPADLVTVYYSIEDEKSIVTEALQQFKGEVEKLTRVTVVPKYLKSDKVGLISEETTEVEKTSIHLYLCKPQVYFQPGALDKYDEKMKEVIELYVHSLNYATLKEKYSKPGSKLLLNLDNKDVTFTSGTDFVFDISMLNEEKKTTKKEPQAQ